MAFQMAGYCCHCLKCHVNYPFEIYCIYAKLSYSVYTKEKSVDIYFEYILFLFSFALHTKSTQSFFFCFFLSGSLTQTNCVNMHLA